MTKEQLRKDIDKSLELHANNKEKLFFALTIHITRLVCDLKGADYTEIDQYLREKIKPFSSEFWDYVDAKYKELCL